MKRPMRILMACTPIPGHVAPLLSAARGLVERGHEVVFNTGSLFRESVERQGARFVALHPEVDHDYRRIDERFPERAQLPEGRAQMLFGLKHLFADAMPRQAEGLQEILRTERIDALVIETTFYGALPLLLGPREHRVPVMALSISVLGWCSVDTVFMGLALPPSSAPRSRARQAAINRFMQQQAFGEVQQRFDEVLTRMDCPPLPDFFLDAGTVLPDLCLQLTSQRFEYPCSDLPRTVRFVGPLLPPAPAFTPPPAWWSDLDSGKPVVVVTQGTLATDVAQLVLPTLEALAEEDVIVVAATAGTDPQALARAMPANARGGGFLPFHHLLPKAHVLVTNGGFGAVNHALSLGVPLVVAGDSEEKPEIGMRVAWAEAGIHLATGCPSPELLRSAVNAVLNDPLYRRGARALQEDFARHDAMGAIEQALVELVGGGRSTA